MRQDVVVTGVGMRPFTKPGANLPYPQMAAQATTIALADAGLGYDQIQQAYVGDVDGDSTAGQRALYEVGMSGSPIFNVNNNCSTGSTALFLARQAVASGAADCVLALGFEQMSPGALGSTFQDRPSPFDHFDALTDDLVGNGQIPLALRYFGGAGQAHIRQYGTKISTVAKIRAKASRHAVNNPMAVFRNEVTEEQVLASPMIWPGVLTRLMACPPTCGAAAAIVCSAEFAQHHGLNQQVRIDRCAQHRHTRHPRRRHRCTTGTLAATLDQRRDAGCHRHDRAWLRLRPEGDIHQGAAGGRQEEAGLRPADRPTAVRTAADCRAGRRGD